MRSADLPASGTPASRFRAGLKQAGSNLMAVRGRSALALVGIVAGIASVIAMLSVGEIVKEIAERQFRELGTEMLMIRRADSGAQSGAPPITLDLVHGLPAEVPDIAHAATWVESSGEVLHDGAKLPATLTLGVNAAFADVNQLPVAEGRFISDLDRYQSYCVIGSAVADAMRGRGPAEGDPNSPVGERIRILGRLFTVIGVLDATGSRRFEQRFNPNNAILAPLASVQRFAVRAHEVRRIIARTIPDARPNVVERDVAGYLGRHVPGVRLEMISPRQLLANMQRQGRLFTLLLAAVGSISLIVGGVGVMNVMLISVSERRGEIGLRRAIGARRRDIRAQFVVESVMLCAAGGLLGILFGVATCYGICLLNDWPFFVSTFAVTLGVCVALGVGAFFGIYPAHQASRLDPIAALRA